MIYYIIGLPGSGKTTFAYKLSEKLGYLPVIDIDNVIETHYGTITDIFETKGAGYFRALEYIKLRDCSEHDNIIISCGGGLPCYQDNMNYMLDNGVVIWLDTPLEVIKSRMNEKEIEKRPLMFKEENVEQYLYRIREEREPYYKEANIVLRNEEDFDTEWAKFEHNRCQRA